jgi:hypothetical protein
MCSPSRSTSTVPVTCPGCRHEGPTYVYLLGELCRCKMCGHDFLMPRHVRMGCPGCGIGLRVLGVMIDCDVSCKFCYQVFRAAPALVSNRKPSAAARMREAALLAAPDDLAAPAPAHRRGHPLDALLIAGHLQSPTRPVEHVASSPVPPPSSAVEDDPDYEAELQTMRAEFRRLERESQEPAERLISVEQVLAGVVGEQAELQAALRRSRTEHDTLASQALEEIERLRAQCGRLEGLRGTATAEPAWRLPPAHPPHQSPKPAVSVSSPRTNGHSRVLTTRPPQMHRASHRPPAGAGANGGNGGLLRESFDRLTNCERLVDGLIGQLKTTQHEKERDRATFERILERLHDQLTTAKDHFEAAHVSSTPSTEREASSRGDSGPIVTGSASAVESSI